MSTYVFSKTGRTLFLLSICGLFLEMLLIRWISTEIRVFAYVQNAVLLVCFVALAAGMLRPREWIADIEVFLPLLILTVLLVVPWFRQVWEIASRGLCIFGDQYIWYALETFRSIGFLPLLVGLAVVVIISQLIWGTMYPIGSLLGALFDKSQESLTAAYSLNVLGSLLGVWLFAQSGYLQLSPEFWVILLTVLLAVCLSVAKVFTRYGLVLCVAIVSICLLARLSLIPGRDAALISSYWSPYQKIELSHGTSSVEPYRIMVNGVNYQSMQDLSAESRQAHPELFHDPVLSYNLPFFLFPNAKKVLVVGAGSGNDVAAALRAGAESIVAVDIDPVIVSLGKRLHPEHPYDSSRVKVVIDDARSFFSRTHEKFDLIVFGLLDSHTVGSQSTVRLDNYVYTRESLEQAKSLLNDGGVVALSFMTHLEFVGSRIFFLLKEVFGVSPLTFGYMRSQVSARGQELFVAGEPKVLGSLLDRSRQVKQFLPDGYDALEMRPLATTDDWPYLYLPNAAVPSVYLLALIGVVLAILIRLKSVWRGLEIAQWCLNEVHFMALGAAFLLLQVAAISKGALVLGSTWIVNAFVISGMLIMILLANYVGSKAPRVAKALGPLGALVCSFALYLFDFHRLLEFSSPTRELVTSLIVTLPVFFSGLIFIHSFLSARSKSRALGANLLGSLIGGIVQTVSFVSGLQFLFLLVSLFYAVAIMCRVRQRDALA